MEKSVSLFSLYECLTHVTISTMVYVRNNFYTVSSAVQIYLNYNVADASKSLSYNRTECELKNHEPRKK